MTPEERDSLLALALDPPKGGKLAAARDFGVDLTLLVSALELAPAERLQRLADAVNFYEEARVIIKRGREQ